MSDEKDYSSESGGIEPDLDIGFGEEDEELEELSEAEHLEVAGIEEDKEGEEVKTLDYENLEEEQKKAIEDFKKKRQQREAAKKRKNQGYTGEQPDEALSELRPEEETVETAKGETVEEPVSETAPEGVSEPSPAGELSETAEEPEQEGTFLSSRNMPPEEPIELETTDQGSTPEGAATPQEMPETPEAGATGEDFYRHDAGYMEYVEETPATEQPTGSAEPNAEEEISFDYNSSRKTVEETRLTGEKEPEEYAEEQAKTSEYGQPVQPAEGEKAAHAEQPAYVPETPVEANTEHGSTPLATAYEREQESVPPEHAVTEQYPERPENTELHPDYTDLQPETAEEQSGIPEAHQAHEETGYSGHITKQETQSGEPVPSSDASFSDIQPSEADMKIHPENGISPIEPDLAIYDSRYDETVHQTAATPEHTSWQEQVGWNEQPAQGQAINTGTMPEPAQEIVQEAARQTEEQIHAAPEQEHGTFKQEYAAPGGENTSIPPEKPPVEEASEGTAPVTGFHASPTTAWETPFPTDDGSTSVSSEKQPEGRSDLSDGEAEKKSELNISEEERKGSDVSGKPKESKLEAEKSAEKAEAQAQREIRISSDERYMYILSNAGYGAAHAAGSGAGTGDDAGSYAYEKSKEVKNLIGKPPLPGQIIDNNGLRASNRIRRELERSQISLRVKAEEAVKSGKISISDLKTKDPVILRRKLTNTGLQEDGVNKALSAAKAEVKQAKSALSKAKTEAERTAAKASLETAKDKLKGAALLRDTFKADKKAINGIVRHREAAHNLIVARTELLSFYSAAVAKNPDAIVFGRNIADNGKALKVLNDPKQFFNTYKNGAKIKTMMQRYFSKHPDPMIREMLPSMKKRDIERLIKQPEKYNLSEKDVTMLKSYLSAQKGARSRILNIKSQLRQNRLYTRGLTNRLIARIDDTTSKGMRFTTRGFRIIKAGIKTQVVTIKLIGKIPPIAKMHAKIKSAVKKAVKTAVTAPVNLVGKGMKTLANVEPIRVARNAVKEAVAKSSVVHGVSKAKAGVVNGVKTAGASVSKFGSIVMASRFGKAMGKVGSGTRTAVNVAAAPFRLLEIILKIIKRILRIVFIAVGIVFFGILVIFFMLCLFVAANYTTNSAGEYHYSISTDENMADHIDLLKKADESKYKRAVDIATKEPKHDPDHIDSKGLYPDEALMGVKLYHYGHPDGKDDPYAPYYHSNMYTSNFPKGGYHIYYIDSSGRMMGQNTTNIKDILSLSTVMVSNNFDKVKSLERQKGMYHDEDYELLLTYLYTYLNPQPVYQVSELYHHEGADVFPYYWKEYPYIGTKYYCDDYDFYMGDRLEIIRQGVTLYDEILPYNPKGCEIDWDSYNSAVSFWSWKMNLYYSLGLDFSDPYPDYNDYYHCPGHEAVSCSYGYRDVNVYVTVLTKDDFYAAVKNGNVLEYKVPKNYACTQWEKKTVEIDIPGYFHKYMEEFEADDGFLNPANVQWCDDIYNQEWYDLYGEDVYSNGVSLPNGEGSLSKEQIEEMLEAIGDVSEARQEVCNFALSMVGQIPYYWGGHANSPDYAANNFFSPVTPDNKGRSQKGLDCSGFVSYVWWHCMSPGSETCPVGQTTATFVPSLGLQQISYNQLKPGDIGMKTTPGAGSNHIGIFVGIDPATGYGIWVHCSGNPRNIVVKDVGYNGFSLYYRLFND